MKVIISREGVGEDGVLKMDEGVVISPFPSFNLCFFESEVSWDKGSFFNPFTRAYLSLLYQVAISANKRSRRMMSFLKTKEKKGKTSQIYFSIPEGSSLTRVQRVQGQGSSHISDEDPQSHQNPRL